MDAAHDTKDRQPMNIAFRLKPVGVLLPAPSNDTAGFPKLSTDKTSEIIPM